MLIETLKTLLYISELHILFSFERYREVLILFHLEKISGVLIRARALIGANTVFNFMSLESACCLRSVDGVPLDLSTCRTILYKITFYFLDITISTIQQNL